MLYKTTLEDFSRFSKKAPRVVVSKEIYGDSLTPVRIFQALAVDRDDVALLDSSDHPTSEDACVYIGFDSIAEFSSIGKEVYVREGQNEKHLKEDAHAALRAFYHRNKCESIHPLAKFAGGMIGFLSYDVVRIFEEIPDRHNNKENIPDMLFKCYGSNIVIDKRTGKVLVTRVVEVTGDDGGDYKAAIVAIDNIIETMISSKSSLKAVSISYCDTPPVEVDIDDAGFKKIVNKAKEYIAKGDAFQIVASRRFQQVYDGDDFNIYRALRVLNPSPYQFFIRHPDFTIVGASPERLVSLQQGIIETMPIAGTRPRGENFQIDQQLEKDLVEDEKENAEHMMLLDLGRNDVGSISLPGSVKVVEQAKIHRYSRVMHMVSRVQGQLDPKYDVFDVVRCCFPAGTLSGAPKIRAMEIIDEIETSKRGVYGGAVVAIDNLGQMDSCITIRTALLKDGIATVRAGGGIVLDSDPQKEADETRHKVQAVLDALALAREGFV